MGEIPGLDRVAPEDGSGQLSTSGLPGLWPDTVFGRILNSNGPRLLDQWRLWGQPWHCGPHVVHIWMVCIESEVCTQPKVQSINL